MWLPEAGVSTVMKVQCQPKPRQVIEEHQEKAPPLSDDSDFDSYEYGELDL